MSKKITLNNRCRINRNESNTSTIYGTRSGKSKIFNIPDSQVISKTDSEIQVNDSFTEPAIEYVVSDWIYSKIEYELILMDKRNVRFD